MLVPLPHLSPLFISSIFRSQLPHDRAGLFWKVRRCADQHHRLDPTWLLSGNVKESLGSKAHAHRLKSFDAQAVEQRKHVQRRLPKRKLLRWIGRATVAAQV